MRAKTQINITFLLFILLPPCLGCDYLMRTDQPNQQDEQFAQKENSASQITNNLNPTTLGTSIGSKILSPVIDASSAILPQKKMDHTNEILDAIENLREDRYETRLYAKETLAEFGEESVPHLIEALDQDGDYQFRVEIGLALSAIGAPAVPELIKALKHENWAIRAVVVESLGDIGVGASQAIPTLIKKLKDPNKVVRRSVVRVLGYVGPKNPKVLKILRGYLTNGDTHSKLNAAINLIRIESNAQAISILVDTLRNHTNEKIRLRVVQAFDELEVKKPEIISALKYAQNGDKSEDIRQYATQVLEMSEN